MSRYTIYSQFKNFNPTLKHLRPCYKIPHIRKYPQRCSEVPYVLKLLSFSLLSTSFRRKYTTAGLEIRCGMNLTLTGSNFLWCLRITFVSIFKWICLACLSYKFKFSPSTFLKNDHRLNFIFKWLIKESPVLSFFSSVSKAIYCDDLPLTQ